MPRADFIHENQEVAFAVSKAYYDLMTAQERSGATRDILKTAQTTQDAAEARLQNGRATLPDVLNARAETAQATFDLASAEGQEQIARVSLAEELGAEPTPDIRIDAQKNAPLPATLDLPIKALVDRAIEDRPDLQAQLLEIQAADQQSGIDLAQATVARGRPGLGRCGNIGSRNGLLDVRRSTGRHSMESVRHLPESLATGPLGLENNQVELWIHRRNRRRIRKHWLSWCP